MFSERFSNTSLAPVAMQNIVLLVCACVVLVRCEVRQFPDGFLFGTSTSSYQIEGGWNADGKSESIWDHVTHTQPALFANGSNGDVANDSYRLYKRDVEMIRELGLDYYRFSVSWPRIFPSGFPDRINQAGVDYYNNVIDELLKYNIQPLMTLYHWELPQKLREIGGWANPEIVTWFTDYARTIFTLFGDRVKYFITMNEPHQTCNYGYGMLTFAPDGIIQPNEEYMCIKNLLVAHAMVYHMYDQEFRPHQRGNIFISISAEWHEPATGSEDDVQAAHEANILNWAIYSWPIFSEAGNFPHEVIEKSARSGLPPLSAREVELIRGSSDFFGLNHYSLYLVQRNASSSPSSSDDLVESILHLSEWQLEVTNHITYAPWVFTKLLNRIRNDYGNPPVIVTENGFATGVGLRDDDRVKYYRGYLDAMLDAMDDGCDVRAYTAWSLMDNFEWNMGYTARFGLYEVDYDNANRTRTARKSAYVYKELLRTRALDRRYEPDMSRPITIDAGH